MRFERIHLCDATPEVCVDWDEEKNDWAELENAEPVQLPDGRLGCAVACLGFQYDLSASWKLQSKLRLTNRGSKCEGV